MSRNSLYWVDKIWLQENENIMQNEAAHVSIIHGVSVTTKQDLIRVLSESFLFPDSIGQVDYVTSIELLQDLTWIKKSGIILVIYEYGEFLSAEPSLKGEFESDLERLIQWWTEDVVGHMVAGFPRPFQVYLEVE